MVAKHYAMAHKRFIDHWLEEQYESRAAMQPQILCWRLEHFICDSVKGETPAMLQTNELLLALQTINHSSCYTAVLLVAALEMCLCFSSFHFHSLRGSHCSPWSLWANKEKQDLQTWSLQLDFLERTKVTAVKHHSKSNRTQLFCWDKLKTTCGWWW